MVATEIGYNLQNYRSDMHVQLRFRDETILQYINIFQYLLLQYNTT